MFQKQTISILGCLFFSGDLVFAFCATSLLHKNICDCNPWDADSSSEDCPACVFKLVAHTEQPVVINTPLLEVDILHVQEEVYLIIQGREPHTILPLRAPPV